MEGRPGASLPPLDFEALRQELEERHGPSMITEQEVMSAALYPKVLEDFLDFRSVYGPVETLDTRLFLGGPKIAEEVEVTIIALIKCLNPFVEEVQTCSVG